MGKFAWDLKISRKGAMFLYSYRSLTELAKSVDRSWPLLSVMFSFQNLAQRALFCTAIVYFWESRAKGIVLYRHLLPTEVVKSVDRSCYPWCLLLKNVVQKALFLYRYRLPTKLVRLVPKIAQSFAPLYSQSFTAWMKSTFQIPLSLEKYLLNWVGNEHLFG